MAPSPLRLSIDGHHDSGFAALHVIEVAALATLLFSLPLSEALKNLSLALFLAAWLGNRNRLFWKEMVLDRWDWIWILWLLSVWLSAQFAGFKAEEWDGFKEAALMIVPAWMVSRSCFSDKEWRCLLWSVVAGAVVGSMVFWLGALTGNELDLIHDPLTFNSIQHFNHSALYLCLALGCAICLIADPGPRLAYPARAAGISAALFLTLSLYGTTSRNAFATAIAAGLLLIVLIPAFRRSLKTLAMIAAALLLVGLAIFGLHARYNPGQPVAMINKFEDNLAQKNILSGRDRIWRVAWAEFIHHPITGVGPKNFGQIDLERLCAWDATRTPEKACEPGKYEIHRHAHSLYFTTLAERGIAGIATLAYILGLMCLGLYRMQVAPQSDDVDPGLARPILLIWTLVAIILGGVLNTTLLIEHGVLATILVALWIGGVRRGVPLWRDKVHPG